MLLNRGEAQRTAVERRHLARDSDLAQAIGTVGGHLDFEDCVPMDFGETLDQESCHGKIFFQLFRAFVDVDIIPEPLDADFHWDTLLLPKKIENPTA